MGKWSAFLVSLIPAGLAGFLCLLLVQTGLSIPDEMGVMFWGPLGAGFLGCVMAILTPFGIAIFVPSAPGVATETAEESSDDIDELDSNEFSDDLVETDFASDDDLDASDFDSSEFADDSSSDFQTAEFSDDDFDDDLSGEFDAFADDDDDDFKA